MTWEGGPEALGLLSLSKIHGSRRNWASKVHSGLGPSEPDGWSEEKKGTFQSQFVLQKEGHGAADRIMLPKQTTRANYFERFWLAFLGLYRLRER